MKSSSLLITTLAAAALASACKERRPGAAWLIASRSDALDLAHARISPESAVRERRHTADGRLELVLDESYAGRLRVEVAGACGLEHTFDGASSFVMDTLQPRAALPPWRVDVGYDHEVTIEPDLPCPPAAPAEIAWRVVEGETSLAIDERGRRVRVRTPSLEHALAPERRWLPTKGIVPISPRTQGTITLEASFVDGATTIKQLVHVVPAARATGVPTIAAGTTLYLFGEGWKSEPDRRGQVVDVRSEHGFTAVAAREQGRHALLGPDGERVAIRVGRHDDMPLDCARAECHQQVGSTIGESAMTHVFERGMTGVFKEPYDPRCAAACHTVGEPGFDDGGFLHVARDLDARLPTAASPSWFANMPRTLRRESGVGCTSCHGPAAIPEPAARWTVLRANVCATCHDAPARYTQVRDWQASRMAIADAVPATRSGECARCHTTAGFLVAIGARGPELATPADEAMGIACAACHSPHARDVGARLVRRVAEGSICVPCHTERASHDGLPRASAARFTERGSHATERGCLTCHEGHDFKAKKERCASCHEAGAPSERPDAQGRTVASRAASLWDELVRRGVVARAPAGRPPHAERMRVSDRAPAALAQAARDVAAVLEDPAAGIHDASTARVLLDAAEAAVQRAPATRLQ